ncbi:hypothetical protein ACOMHN_066405 [Nucella lapillus]
MPHLHSPAAGSPLMPGHPTASSTQPCCRASTDARSPHCTIYTALLQGSLMPGHPTASSTQPCIDPLTPRPAKK